MRSFCFQNLAIWLKILIKRDWIFFFHLVERWLRQGAACGLDLQVPQECMYVFVCVWM